ncbi:MAG: YfiR family protein [Pseudomonadota bacterium]
MKYWLALALTMYSLGVMAKTPEQIRSAFLYQMANFIEFPAMDEAGIRFCFYDLKSGPGAILNKNKSLKIKGLPILIQKVEKNTAIKELSEQCDITYFDGALGNDILSSYNKSTPLDMLMVSDNLSFLDNEGMAALVQEGNKIRLYVNKQQIAKHNFKVLSRLLAVAKFHPN